MCLTTKSQTASPKRRTNLPVALAAPYRPIGLRQDPANPQTTVIHYTYDPLYRLTQASYSSGANFTYTYDAAGNRLTENGPGGAKTYNYDAADRLTTVNGTAYTWDNNGNLLNDGQRTFSYDTANRLKQVVSGTLTTQYAYLGDPLRCAPRAGGTA
jgi:YD repeat-containing protein